MKRSFSNEVVTISSRLILHTEHQCHGSGFVRILLGPDQKCCPIFTVYFLYINGQDFLEIQCDIFFSLILLQLEIVPKK